MPSHDDWRELRVPSWLKTVLTLVFVAAAIAYVALHFGEIRDIDWPSSTSVVVVVAGFVASVFLRSLLSYIAARRLGAELSLAESYSLSAVVTATNAILPAGAGATFRAYYMKSKHAMPLAYFAGATMLSFLVTTLFMSLVGMFVLLLIFQQLGYFRLDLFIILPVIAIGTATGLIWRSENRADDHHDSFLAAFKYGMLRLVADNRLVAASMTIVAVNFVVAAAVWTFVLQERAPEIDTLETLFFAITQIVGGLITLTPGAAGFQELIGLYVGRSFDIGAFELFAILIWVRAVRLISAVALAAPCAIYLRLSARNA